MCLPIDCWLCTPRTDDDHYHAPATKHSAPPLARNGGGHHYNGNVNGGHRYNGNGSHYYNGTGYPVQGAAAAGAEADRKASKDARPRGWHGHAPAQEKMVAYPYPYAGAADGTLKQQQPPAASNGRVAADGARGVAHNYYYEREQPPAHKGKEDAVDSYYHPAATVAPADHERY